MNKTIVLTSSLIVLTLTACGGAPKVGDKPLTQEQADALKLAAPTIVSGVVDAVQSNAQPAAALASGLAQFAAAQHGDADAARVATAANTPKPQAITVSGNCGPSPSSLTDNDNDRIPANYSASFQDCTVFPILFIFERVQNGSEKFIDANDNDPKSGFSREASNRRDDYFIKDNTKRTQVGSFTWNGKATVNAATGSGGSAVSFDYTLAFTSFKSGAADKTWTFGLKFTGSSTPDADSNQDPHDAATVNFQGSLTSTDPNGATSTFGLTFTSLKYTATCDAPVSGTVRFDDGGTNFLEMTYTSCGKGTYKYNASDSGSF